MAKSVSSTTDPEDLASGGDKGYRQLYLTASLHAQAYVADQQIHFM